MGDNEMTRVAVPRAAANEVVATNGMSSSVQRSGEMASNALATQARAATEARYVMAIQRPRDLMKVREKLLMEAKRPGFAKEAIYHKPIGKGVEGPSIRLAEAAARAMGNVYCPVYAIYDDAEKRISRVTATDLENNLTFDKDVTVTKTVERRSLQQGQVALGTRVGAGGQILYIVEASDDDILNKENALASKALRECLLRLLPGDIKSEVLAACRETTLKNIKDDPQAAQKGMCDGFRELGVTIDQLKDYLGHAIEVTTVEELATMRALYSAIRDGEASWKEAMDNRGGDPKPKGENKPPASVADAAAEAKARREAASAPPASKTPTPTVADAAPAAQPTNGATQQKGPTEKTKPRVKVEMVPRIPIEEMSPKEREDWDKQLAEAADPSGGVIK